MKSRPIDRLRALLQQVEIHETDLKEEQSKPRPSARRIAEIRGLMELYPSRAELEGGIKKLTVQEQQVQVKEQVEDKFKRILMTFMAEFRTHLDQCKPSPEDRLFQSATGRLAKVAQLATEIGQNKIDEQEGAKRIVKALLEYQASIQGKELPSQRFSEFLNKYNVSLTIQANWKDKDIIPFLVEDFKAKLMTKTMVDSDKVEQLLGKKGT